jgi:hypothetical protein
VSLQARTGRVFRHSRESGNPVVHTRSWIPAFAGMTVETFSRARSIDFWGLRLPTYSISPKVTMFVPAANVTNCRPPIE